MKNLLLMLTVLLSFTTFAQHPFTIKGSAKELKNGEKIYLIYANEVSRKTDSTTVFNGFFELKGVLNGDPALGSLHRNLNPIVNGVESDFLYFYITNGTILVNTNSSLKFANVTGSQINVDYNKLNTSLKLYIDKMTAVNVEYAGYFKLGKVDNDKLALIQEKSQKIFDEMNPIYLRFIKENPASYLSLISLQRFADNEYYTAQAEALFAKLSPDLKTYNAAKSLIEIFETKKNTAIGVKAMNFTINDAQEKPVSLTDFKGNYVLVDFWASWNNHARVNETPSKIEAYNKFKNKNFTILGVAIESSKTSWLKAITDDKLTWPQVSSLDAWKSEVLKKWGIRGISANFLIDPTGKIIAKNLMGQALTDKLEELLGDKKK